MVQSRFPDQKPNATFTFGTNLNRAGRLWRTVFRSLAGLEARPTPYLAVLSYLITGAEGATQKGAGYPYGRRRSDGGSGA